MRGPYIPHKRRLNFLCQTTSETTPAFPGGRACVKLALLHQGIPEVTWPVCLAAIRQSTLKTYTPVLRQWWNYCQEDNTPTFSPPEKILIFLQEEFDSSHCFASINCARAALGQILPKIMEGNTAVKRLCAGVAHLRPGAPKYDKTWDPSCVFSYIREQSDNDLLSLLQLSRKLVILLALATAQR